MDIDNVCIHGLSEEYGGTLCVVGCIFGREQIMHGAFCLLCGQVFVNENNNNWVALNGNSSYFYNLVCCDDWWGSDDLPIDLLDCIVVDAKKFNITAILTNGNSLIDVINIIEDNEYNEKYCLSLIQQLNINN